MRLENLTWEQNFMLKVSDGLVLPHQTHPSMLLWTLFCSLRKGPSSEGKGQYESTKLADFLCLFLCMLWEMCSDNIISEGLLEMSKMTVKWLFQTKIAALQWLFKYRFFREFCGSSHDRHTYQIGCCLWNKVRQISHYSTKKAKMSPKWLLLTKMADL